MAEVAEVSRRERNKEARRIRIAQAAFDLLREVGMAELTVQMIAERAAVSPATVYNLFGTKGAVLAAVYAADLRRFEEHVARRRPADALVAIFDAWNLAVNVYRADEAFYRAMLSARDAGLDAESVLLAHRARVAFWQRKVAAAQEEGWLAADADTGRLAMAMIQLCTGALIHWIAEMISLDELEAEVGFGFASLLHPAATSRGVVALGEVRAAMGTELDALAERRRAARRAAG